MATAMPPERSSWTLGELYRRFGAIPFDRIRWSDPAPGTATEEDVVRLYEREKGLYELVDGVLLRKTMGYRESIFAGFLITLLNQYVLPRKLGFVAAPDGLVRLNPEMIRIPDVSFVAAARFPDGRVPDEPICPVVPDLAVEVLSKGNTKKEMTDKLADYFAAGVRLVWYIDPDKQTARVFTAVNQSRLLREADTLDGGDVLPGFALPLRELFAEPLAGGPMA
jgi:Uma2 family endonuclease